MKKPVVVLWTITKVAIALLAIGWCVLHVRRFDLYFPFVPPASSRPVGIALMILGGAVVLSCGGILSTRGILETPADRLFPKEFVAFGPFRYLRNPMSLGVVILLCGIGLYERSVSLLLLTLLLFVFLHLIVVYVEEPGLEKRFGSSYRTYKQSTNRWLPSFPRIVR